jgi:hypothetical protein
MLSGKWQIDTSGRYAVTSLPISVDLCTRPTEDFFYFSTLRLTGLKFFNAFTYPNVSTASAVLNLSH